jgi:hypothetical protein
MISTKEVVIEEKGNGGKGFSYGIAKMKITDYVIIQSQSGKIKVDFFIETDDEVEDGYEYEGTFGKHVAKGKTARIAMESPLMCNDGKERMNNWAEPTNPKFVDKVLKDFAVIANAVGVREQVDAIQASLISDFIGKAVAIVKDKYFYPVIKAEEQLSQDGQKTYLHRTFKSYVQKDGDIVKSANMIAQPVEGSELTLDGKVQVLLNNGKEIRFDPDNVWDYKPLAKPDTNPSISNPAPTVGSELPF